MSIDSKSKQKKVALTTEKWFSTRGPRQTCKEATGWKPL